jgi:outer membrane immunogenic protein
MKRILLASVAALGLAGTASAADLAVQAPAVVPLFTWTGCYLGINGGWIGSNSDYSTSRQIVAPYGDPNSATPVLLSQGSVATATANQVNSVVAAGNTVGDGLRAGQTATASAISTNPALSAGQAAAAAIGPAPLSAYSLVNNSFSSDASSGTAGGQFGCQYQWGWFVLGGEWDLAWSGLKDDSYVSYPALTDPATGFTWAPRTQLFHNQLDWFSTARVRLGAAWWDRVLLYVTGGVALGAHDSYTQIAFNLNNANPNFVPQYYGAYREKRIGWTVGGGFEWAFAQNWTAKAEFLYLDFGSFDYISPRTTFGGTLGGVTDGRVWNTSVESKEYVARVGINYLFHLGPAVGPVVARY